LQKQQRDLHIEQMLGYLMRKESCAMAMKPTQ